VNIPDSKATFKINRLVNARAIWILRTSAESCHAGDWLFDPHFLWKRHDFAAELSDSSAELILKQVKRHDFQKGRPCLKESWHTIARERNL